VTEFNVSRYIGSSGYVSYCQYRNGCTSCSVRVRFCVKCGTVEISYVAENSVLNSTVLLNLLLRSLLKYTRRMQSNVACSTKRTDSAFLLFHKCSVLSTVPRYEIQEFEC